MLEAVISSIVAFAATNLDDAVINTFFFAKAETKRAERAIFVGKYLGIGALTALSLLCSLTLRIFPEKYLSLLGIVPILLGINELISHCFRKNGSDIEDLTESSAAEVLTTALVTVSNGADNIGVYIPLFAGFTWVQILAAVGVFAAMTALWCVVSQRLASLPALKRFLTRHRQVIVPAVYILLGVYILVG